MITLFKNDIMARIIVFMHYLEGDHKGRPYIANVVYYVVKV